MNIRISHILLGIFIAVAAMLSSCNEDNEVQPITVNFTNSEVGISSTNPSVEIEVTFSRAVSSSGMLKLTLDAGSLELGSDKDFSIGGASGSQVTVSYEAGVESASFTLSTGSGLNIDQDESLTISLQQSEDGDFIIGETASITVTFSENYVAPAGSMELQGGGPTFPNQVFADLSKLSQTSVDKYSWDLGFYSGATFNVIVNSSAAVMARPIDKTDLASVTASDTLTFAYEMTIPPPNFDPSIGSAAWVDSPDGNLETTAFGAISATDSENKVFIIKRDGDGRNWKKVRVLQNGSGYTLQYADIAATTFTTLEISKNDTYNFTFADLDNGITSVQPASDSWDFMYSTYTEALNLGGPGMDIPYLYNDFIVLNRNNTKIAMVMIADVAFADFNASHISNLNFESDIDAFGENWRSGGGPSSGPALHTDRFFVIEDAEGNVFKLQFDRLTSLEGERGTPAFTFENIYK